MSRSLPDTPIPPTSAVRAMFLPLTSAALSLFASRMERWAFRSTSPALEKTRFTYRFPSVSAIRMVPDALAFRVPVPSRLTSR